MSSSNSSEMDDHIVMAFSGVMDEAMSIFEVEEATAVATSSSTRRLKRHRRYVYRDHEAAYFKLRHDYFDYDYVYPVILLSEVSYADDFFSKHYA
jgi:hypothetical protein